MGDISAFTRRALSAAFTESMLALSSRCSSVSWRPKASTVRTDSKPCCSTLTMSLWRLRTSCVAFFTAFFSRATNNSRKGVTPTAMSAKSKLR